MPHFTDTVNARLQAILGETAFKTFQASSYEVQMGLIDCLVNGPAELTKYTEQKSDIDKLLPPANQKQDAELVNIFSAYTPHMINAGTLQAEVAASKTASTSATGETQFFVFGPNVDAYASAGYPCFAGAVIQAASQLNNLEFPNPTDTHPAALSSDNTQGPAVQKGNPALALARYMWWKNNNEENSFLRNWQTLTIEVGTGPVKEVLSFSDIFDLKNGYMHPKDHMVDHAITFVRAHKDQLLLNMETTDFTKTGHPIHQVLAAAMALGRYDYDYTTNKQINRTAEEKAQLTVLCQEFLTIQYEMTAMKAIVEAQKDPHKRVPLLLTAVGGGVFKNDRAAIDAAIAAAVKKVIDSGITNIDFGVMAYTETAAAHMTTSLQKAVADAKGSTTQQQVIQLETKDLATAHSLSQFHPAVAAKTGEGKKETEAPQPRKTTPPTITEAVDVLASFDEAQKKKVLAEAMSVCEVALTNTQKIKFTDITITLEDVKSTIQAKIALPGSDQKTTVTKTVSITRLASTDGKTVTRHCEGELTTEQRYTIIATTSFQERVAAAKETGKALNTRIDISIQNPNKLPIGKDGLTSDERALVKAYLAAGYTEVYCGKNAQAFTKESMTDHTITESKGSVQGWRKSTAEKKEDKIECDHVMQLAEATRSATGDDKAAKLADFRQALLAFVDDKKENAVAEIQKMKDQSELSKAVIAAVEGLCDTSASKTAAQKIEDVMTIFEKTVTDSASSAATKKA